MRAVTKLGKFHAEVDKLSKAIEQYYEDYNDEDEDVLNESVDRVVDSAADFITWCQDNFKLENEVK